MAHDYFKTSTSFNDSCNSNTHYKKNTLHGKRQLPSYCGVTLVFEKVAGGAQYGEGC
jgi:hypothetical protein